MTIPLNVKEIKKLKQKGIEIRPHNMNTSISYEVVLSLKGVQALLSYINNQRLPKIGNRLDFEFFSAFLKKDISLRDLYVQYQPICRNRTLDDNGFSPAHHIMLYVPYEAPVAWFSLIQVGNLPLQDEVPSMNYLMGGALMLPDNTETTSWRLTLNLETSERSKLQEYDKLWFEKVIVLTGSDS